MTHEWRIETKYYSATIPIWLDELRDVNEWKSEFLKPEAKEVIEAIGAFAFCYQQTSGVNPADTITQATDAITNVINEQLGHPGDAILLAIGVPPSKNGAAIDPDIRNELDDITIDAGFEFIDYAATGTSEYGEKQGKARLREALEAHEWAQSVDQDDDDFLEDDFDQLAHEDAEASLELSGLKMSLMEDRGAQISPDDTQPADVDDLDVMLGKLLAVREQSADLPEAQRRRLAARAVRELMDQTG